MKKNLLTLMSLLIVAFSAFSCKESEAEAPIFKTETESIDFTAEGGSQNFTIEANVAWTIKASADAGWLTISPMSGTDSEKITVEAAENESEDELSATITISAAELKPIEIKVNIDGAEPVQGAAAIEFADANFKKALLDTSLEHSPATIDADGDGEIQASEAAAVTSINVSGQEISDLSGIEYFTAVKELKCAQNTIKSIDLSKNKDLMVLVCADNELTTLDITKLSKLESLYCYENAISEIDLSGNAALKEVQIYGNGLTALDLSKNTAVNSIDCSHNKIANLDLESNLALKFLWTNANSLLKLNVAKNTELSTIYCGNQVDADGKAQTLELTISVYQNSRDLVDERDEDNANINVVVEGAEQGIEFKDEKFEAALLKVSEGDLTSPDYTGHIPGVIDANGDGVISIAEASKVTRLGLANCGIKDMSGIEHFTSLEYLDIKDNSTEIVFKLNENTKLTTLDCSGNGIGVLDLSANTALEYLYCQDNILTSFSAKTLENLKVFHIYKNQMSALDTSKCAKLEELICGAQTDVQGGNRRLRLVVSEEQSEAGVFDATLETNKDVVVVVTGIDFADPMFKAALLDTHGYDPENMWANGHIPEVIDANGDGEISKAEAEAVTRLAINNHSINSIEGIEFFPNLETLNCYSNGIITMDLSKNTKLKSLSCQYNDLVALDLTENDALTSLVCSFNEISDLKLGNKPNLKSASCTSNRMTSVDVSGCTAITMLNVDNNRLTSIDLSKNEALETLNVYVNQLTALDCSKNANLQQVSCYDNKIASLDFENNPMLQLIWCYDNDITSFDAAAIPSLLRLDIYDNHLTKLDVTDNEKLIMLYCGNQTNAAGESIKLDLTMTEAQNQKPVLKTNNNNNDNVNVRIEGVDAADFTVDISLEDIFTSDTQMYIMLQPSDRTTQYLYGMIANPDELDAAYPNEDDLIDACIAELTRTGKLFSHLTQDTFEGLFVDLYPDTEYRIFAFGYDGAKATSGISYLDASTEAVPPTADDVLGDISVSPRMEIADIYVSTDMGSYEGNYYIGHGSAALWEATGSTAQGLVSSILGTEAQYGTDLTFVNNRQVFNTNLDDHHLDVWRVWASDKENVIVVCALNDDGTQNMDIEPTVLFRRTKPADIDPELAISISSADVRANTVTITYSPTNPNALYYRGLWTAESLAGMTDAEIVSQLSLQSSFVPGFTAGERVMRYSGLSAGEDLVAIAVGVDYMTEQPNTELFKLEFTTASQAPSSAPSNVKENNVSPVGEILMPNIMKQVLTPAQAIARRRAMYNTAITLK